MLRSQRVLQLESGSRDMSTGSSTVAIACVSTVAAIMTALTRMSMHALQTRDARDALLSDGKEHLHVQP